jgi:hypothetical protein
MYYTENGKTYFAYGSKVFLLGDFTLKIVGEMVRKKRKFLANMCLPVGR